MDDVLDKLKTQKYSAYKDTNVDWLGKIPENWEAVSLGSLLELKSDKNHPDYDVLSVYREYGVILKGSRDDNHNATSLDTTNYKAVEPGYLVVNKMKAWQGSMGISSHKGIVSPAYITCKVTSDKINPEYLHLLLRCKLYISEYNRISYGVRVGQWDMHYEDFKKVPVLLPSKEEQTRIAQFLDDKCEKIDRAIAQKQKLIELLKERRQIIIQNAVTKGLNPVVKMKDSGVEWIGEVPEAWEVKRLASFGRFSKGGGFSKSDLTEKGISAILYGDIYTKYDFIIDKGVRNISNDTSKKSVKIDTGDLLFTGSGETIEDIGKCVVYRSEERAYAGGDVIIFKQNENDSLYLSYVLNTHNVKSEKAKTSKGEIIVHTYSSKLRNIYVPIPPMAEQELISEFIVFQSSKIDKAISFQENQIEKLKEYKSTLIDSAVRGRVKVN